MAGCLGLSAIDCNYDSVTSQPVFSIGELLAVLGLILAFRALAQPRIRFRLGVAGFSEKTALLVLLLACASTLAAIFLRLNEGWRWPLLGYPIFWEIVAAAAMLGLTMYVLVISSQMSRFRRRNARRYYLRTISAIARADSDELAALTEELRPSVQPVVEACASYNQWEAEKAKEQGKEYPVSDYVRAAFTVLDAWADPRLCKSMVVRAPGTAIDILQSLAGRRHIGQSLVNELVDQALSEPESMLYREEKYSPLGRHMFFSRAIAGNYQFFTSYCPLQAWSWRSRRAGNRMQFEKFGELLLMALEQYFDSKDFHQRPYALWSAFHQYAEDVRGLVWRLNDSEHLAVSDDETSGMLSAVSFVLRDAVDMVKRREGSLPEYPPLPDDASKYDDPSIFGVLANAIYTFIEQLAQAKRHEYLVRSALLDVWHEVFPLSEGDSSSGRREIRKRLVPLIEDKIDENLDPEQRYYPAITRLLIDLLGLHKPAESASTPRCQDSCRL